MRTYCLLAGMLLSAVGIYMPIHWFMTFPKEFPTIGIVFGLMEWTLAGILFFLHHELGKEQD